jgi:hypothetical protein
MKDAKVARLLDARKRLSQHLPDASIVFTGSLLRRMVRCNKPSCRICKKPDNPGHGPIWILSVSIGQRRIRQIPVPNHLKPEVAAGLRRFAEIQKLLKKIGSINQELLVERKKA